MEGNIGGGGTGGIRQKEGKKLKDKVKNLNECVFVYCDRVLLGAMDQ